MALRDRTNDRDRIEDALLDLLRGELRTRLRDVPTEAVLRINLDETVAAMLEVIPDAGGNPFDELGPFYDTAGLTSWLDISRQAVADRVARHTVLRLVTGNGASVYPAWQFTRNGDVVPAMRPVLRLLLPVVDPWSTAVWLTAASERLGGATALELLRDGDADHHVLGLAREDAARLAS